MKLISWVKENKLAAALILILLYFFGQNILQSFLGISVRQVPSYEKGMSSSEAISSPQLGGIGGLPIGNIAPKIGYVPPPPQDYAPAPQVKDRLVIQQSYLSLLVEDARGTVDKILEYTSQNGGYMVNSSIENPGEAPFATVVVRIPSNRLSAALSVFRNLSIRVVSENLTGRDVTDQYVDIDARLETLEKTKAKFEGLLDSAVEISDILKIQKELINLESQIDHWKGQQEYLEQSSQMAKVTIYLSTDEIALPYTPTETWRADVIFKLAVRSLISNLRKAATAVIWIMVYSVIWVPIIIVFHLVRKRRRKSSSNI